MADRGIMDNAKDEFADIGKWFAPACKFFPAGLIFCFLFGGNIFKALGFIGLVYLFSTVAKIGNNAITQAQKKGRKSRAK